MGMGTDPNKFNSSEILQKKDKVMQNGSVKYSQIHEFPIHQPFDSHEYIHPDYSENSKEFCPSTPLITRVLVNICHFILFAIAFIAEQFYRNYDDLQRLNARPREREELRDFAPLDNHFQGIFTNQIYPKICDVLNRPIAGVPGRYVKLMDNGTVTNMGSYNYLGFSQCHGPCAEAAADELSITGIGSCSTRAELGVYEMQQELEEKIAWFLGVEAAICFPMGFGINSTSLPILADQNTLVISDELNHSSLILGMRMSHATVRKFRHNDPNDLERKLEEAFFQNERRFRKILIVVEGIYSMEGTIVNLPKIIEIKKKYKAYLFIDEAHSIGALGPTGRGVLEYWQCDCRDVDILMGTLTKSFAGAGGYVAGSKKLINHLRHTTAGSVYGSIMPPPITAQILTSLKIISGLDGTNIGREKCAKLLRNTRYFRRRLRQMGFIVYGHDASPVIPVLGFYIPKVACFGRETLKHGLAVVSVGWPATAMNKPRVRFCVSSEHTKEQLEEALKIADMVGTLSGMKYLKRTDDSIKF